MVSVWASQLLSTLIMLITVWQINKLNLIELKGMLSLLDILMICCCMCWWYVDNVIGAILALMWPYNTACMIRPHSLLPYAPTKTTEKLTLADLIFPQVYTTCVFCELRLFNTNNYLISFNLCFITYLDIVLNVFSNLYSVTD